MKEGSELIERQYTASCLWFPESCLPSETVREENASWSQCPCSSSLAPVCLSLVLPPCFLNPGGYLPTRYAYSPMNGLFCLRSVSLWTDSEHFSYSHLVFFQPHLLHPTKCLVRLSTGDGTSAQMSERPVSCCLSWGLPRNTRQENKYKNNQTLTMGENRATLLRSQREETDGRLCSINSCLS